MSNAEYDIKKLKRYDEIDAEGAISAFDDRSEYFERLTLFAEECMEYLTKYNAYQISTRNESRAGFIQEIQKLRESFTTLGMNEALLDLKYLEKSVISKEMSIFEHELSEFRNRMRKISGIINSARVGDGGGTPGSARDTRQSGRMGKSPDIAEIKASGADLDIDEIQNFLNSEDAKEILGVKNTQKKIIMAVDDMPALLASIVKMLQAEYTVIAVTSAGAALNAVKKQTPSLFLLDIEMPGMNGYDLAEELRKIDKFSAVPIIFLTALNTREDVISAIQHGGNDYIVKPVDKELLLSKLHRYLT